MKAKNLIFLATLTIFITSCYREEFGTDGFQEEEFGEEEFDDFDDEQGEEGSLTLYKIQGGELDKIEDYDVQGNLLNLQQDYGKHIKMWEFVKRLVPQEERKRIAEFMVFYGNDDLAGYVEPVDENDLSQWRFGLAIEIADNLEEIDFKDFFTYVTIHELGHVVTLKETQVNATVSENQCSNYFPGEGCANSNSYINGLYELGWSDLNLNNENLYDQYKDRFVSDYAATNPGEDIAEVFTFFITEENRRSGNSIADQKVNMLYEFPELVKLRDQMRSTPVVRALKAGSWLSNPLSERFRMSHKNCTGHKHAAHAHYK